MRGQSATLYCFLFGFFLGQKLFFFPSSFVVLVAEDESVFFEFPSVGYFFFFGSMFMFWLVAVDVFQRGCVFSEVFLFFHHRVAVIVVYILFLARFEYFAVHVLSCNNLIVGFGSLKAAGSRDLGAGSLTILPSTNSHPIETEERRAWQVWTNCLFVWPPSV